ncbi:MAG: hypothetical protein NTX08_02540 [Sphingobacteriales bacterium]|nr:hypothetical protein [Sphingobacteriales bacterium]
MKTIVIGLLTSFSFIIANAQKVKEADSSKILKEVIVTGYKTVNGVGHLLEVKDGIILEIRTYLA